jgi:hypothetical protein
VDNFISFVEARVKNLEPIPLTRVTTPALEKLAAQLKAWHVSRINFFFADVKTL